MANYWKTSIVIGSGNEGSAAVHTAGKLTLNEEQEVEIAVSAYEASLNLQIWKNYVDEIGVSVIHPGDRTIAADTGNPEISVRRNKHSGVLWRTKSVQSLPGNLSGFYPSGQLH